jgi:phage terminase small subunit
MLGVMNDPTVDEKIRLQAANWAAPYFHPKASMAKGKKEEREDKAKSAGAGRFSASQPPKLKALK